MLLVATEGIRRSREGLALDADGSASDHIQESCRGNCTAQLG